jgi:hypothetical protein
MAGIRLELSLRIHRAYAWSVAILCPHLPLKYCRPALSGEAELKGLVLPQRRDYGPWQSPI